MHSNLLIFIQSSINSILNHLRRKIGKKVEYVICTFSLCGDVLCDVLQFGTRRQLSTLERVGCRLLKMISNRFVEKPFLYLSIQTISDCPYHNDRKYKSCNCNPFGQLLSAPGIPLPQELMYRDLSEESDDIRKRNSVGGVFQ